MRAKVLFSIIGACTLFATTAQAQIRVNVDGSPVEFNGTRPIKVGGRVLVPLRGVMEKIGAEVTWTQSLQRIDARKGDTTVVLQIGQRQASVDGRTVNLDVPAMVVAGSTMVPLRFLGEAMGAEVFWNNATSTVDITTEGSGGGGTTGGTTISIASFNHDAGGWIRQGQSVRFNLRGTPGATASVIISGIDSDVRLTEQARGEYFGTWTPGKAMGLSKATVLGRLEKDGIEKLIQSSDTISVDNQPPMITIASPTENSQVTGRPTIAANLDDNAGSGINTKSVTLTLNGRSVVDDAAITGRIVSYKPSGNLSPGQYTVVVSAKDNAGNLATETWKFKVGTGASVITSVTHDGTGKLKPGQVITFTLLAEPKGKAHFAIGSKFRRGTREVAPGKYVGEYTIRATDDLAGETVTAVYTSASGEVYTLAADRPLGGTTASTGLPVAPVVVEPRNNENAPGSIVVRGRSAAGNQILVRVDYETTIVGLKVTGPITELSTLVNGEGEFSTEEIALSPPLNGRNTIYTISVTAMK